MLRNHQLDRVRKIFADQFTEENGRIVYRKNLKGEAIPVSAEERDRFVQNFNVALGRIFWGAILTTFALIAVGVTFSAMALEELNDLAMWAIILAPIAAFAPLWVRAWQAPARELAGRIPTASALEPDEFRRHALKRLTWGQLLAALLAPGLMLWQIGRDHDLTAGWNRLWLVGAGALLALVGVQAYRKWRADRI